MFENVDGRTDGRRTDAGVTGILIAHLGAFGSGELKTKKNKKLVSIVFWCVCFFFYFHRFASKQLVVPKSRSRFPYCEKIGFPSQSTFRFFIWGPVKSAE